MRRSVHFDIRRFRAVIGFVGGGCALVFILLGVLVRNGLSPADRWVIDHVVVLPGSPLHQAALVLSTVTVLSCAAVLVAVALRAWWRRPRRGADLLWCLALLLCCGLLAALQFVFRRPGPPGQPEGFSYPSGHASVAGAFAVVAVLIAAVFVRKWLLVVVAVQGGALLLTMAARVALTEHYVTDVLGAVLGICAVGLLGAAAVKRWWVDSPA
ncbi:phosphatase PAP2 family protein [Amycolatopsis magusensis]|uniref:Undecaprenyl-diphosphatase n=1 Tax=Amycolatopsis magusensis TaxID=882444 RepID=A0ABS4PXJ1_9PSEU|nr:phosphatase PAP2 family protein [Amycolatopsis magusensis]MBP2183563.1 undecaprenyl-diphosphatase [Amycolatopsis magusensis]MDI5975027.1 phosphatase PAP2 family protein [Amycolatopsis magusensis]